MSFEEFQNQLATLRHWRAWSRTRSRNSKKRARSSAKKAEDYIGECYGLHEAFALSLRPAKSPPQ